MTAYEMCESKIKILTQINYLEGEMDNETETVLLTNGEVTDVVNALKDCLTILDDALIRKEAIEAWNRRVRKNDRVLETF